MRKITYLSIILLFVFSNQVLAIVADCVSGKRSESVNLIMTEHTVLYTLAELCKPQLVADFSAVKQNGTSIYNLNWSKQDHDLWHVATYDVRVNGVDVSSFANTVTLPLSIDLALSEVPTEVSDFEVRACSSLPSDDPLNPLVSCGDWQSTVTQCDTECTNASLSPPALNVPVDTNTTGAYTISWSGAYTRFELQESTTSSWVSVYDGANLSFDFINQSNGNSYSYKVRGCNDNVCSDYSTVQTISVLYPPTAIPTITVPGPVNTTGNYTVSWTSSTYATRYELHEKINNGSWSIIQDNETFSRVFTNINNTYTYKVRACNQNICGNYSLEGIITVDIPTIIAVPTAFDVYEDINTNRRFLTWQGNISNDGLGTISYIIKAYDQGNNIVFQRQIAKDSLQPYVLNDLTPVKYTISECTSSQCSNEMEDFSFEQGLSRVIDLSIDWVNIATNNNRFKFEFNYPNELLSKTGPAPSNPTEFKIYSDIGSTAGANLILTVPFTAGNTSTGWQSGEVIFAASTGNSFKVYACNQTLGCGVASEVSVGAPITSANLMKPTGVSASSGGSQVQLRWDVTNTSDIDYFEITEKHPLTRADGVYSNSLNSAISEKMFYLDIDDVRESAPNHGYKISMKRQTRGNYRYKLRSCKRDREFGDVCSAQTSWADISISRVNSNDIGLVGGIVELPTSLGWYEFIKNSTTKYALSWEFDHPTLNYKPDYFYITNADETGVNSCGIKQFTVGYADKVIESGKIKWTTEVDCQDLGMTSQWQVQSCINGVGCSPYSSTIVVGDTAQQNNTSTNSLILGSQTVIGGPGDFNPGLWWHPELSGTGWHFYWASELRYDSTDEDKYKATYDLIGYWFAYREINGVWTPTWFEARMKQVLDNDGGGYFEGDIFYHHKSDTTNFFEKLDAGHIQLNFGGNNQHAQLVITPNYTGGLFSAISSAEDLAPYVSSLGKLYLDIEDFAVSNVGSNFGPENDADHYTGLWQHYDVNDNPDVSLLTWIEHGFEFTSIATFDSAGVPIWLQATASCDGTTCYPTGDYFDDYDSGTNVSGTVFDSTVGIVHHGFNPLSAKPLDHDFGGSNGDFTNYHGKFGRCFSSTTDNMRFRAGRFWMNITDDLVYTDVDGNTYTRTISNYGLSSNSCNTSSTQALIKSASLHDIRFFINGNDETITSCDPNIETECVLNFTWYTDDDFSSIEPYYSTDNGLTYDKLNDICPGVPQDKYVTTKFECTIPDAGEYIFQLHKDKYGTTTGETIAIAESQKLTILACQSALCEGSVGAPESAPEPELYLTNIAPIPANDLVGVTSGAFDIDESGSANYSIPIFAPAARGGLTPQMALSYNSNAGNGIAGVGWNISGTSSITRCLKSPEHDPDLNFYPPIQMDETDALCLDGQRLFKLADGSYRTEMDSFSRITTIGTAGNGPNKFKIETKSGEIRVYGSPGSSFIANKVFLTGGTGAQIISDADIDNDGFVDGTVHTWLLNKIEDRNGNNIYFVWDTKAGENFLSHVKWTNPATGDHHYQIDFEYTDSRTDAMHHYGIGTEYKAYRNLKHISTFIRPQNLTSSTMQEVRRLKLNYETATNPTGMLRLASIEQCLNAGSCLQPVQFDWDNNNTQLGFEGGQYSSANIGKFKEMGFGSFKPIDINGDGQMELMFVRGYDDGNFLFEDLKARYWVAYHVEGNEPPIPDLEPSPENPYGVQICEPVDGGYYNYICDTGLDPFDAGGSYADRFNGEKWFILDYNSDGYQDILTPHDAFPGDNNNDNWFVYLSNGTKICNLDCAAYQPIDTGIIYYSRQAGSSLLDYTADGLPDLMTFDLDSSSGTDLYKYKLFPMIKGVSGYRFANNSDSEVTGFVEIDNDKLIPGDMICQYSDEPEDIPCVSRATQGDIPPLILAGKLEITASDFNGDGYNDAIYQYRYRYVNEACGLTSSGSGISGYSNLAFMPAGEYTSEALNLETNTSNAQTPTQHCEQRFRVAMLFEKDNNTGAIKFTYAGRLGIMDNYSDNNDTNDNDLPLVSCEASTLDGCIGDINRGIGASKIVDVNGDGLADHAYLTGDNQYKYQLNTGIIKPQAVAAFSEGDNSILAYTYDKLIFSTVKSAGLPAVTTDGFCDTKDLSVDDHDQDACGRRFLTQFIDYDLDGDTDILYPALASESGSLVRYKLKKYQQLANGEFGYQEYGIANSEQVTSYSKAQEPQAYINTMFDLNGDGHADFFSLLRDIDPTDSNNTKSQTINMGSNLGQARNKITTITNVLDNQQTHINIAYKVATDPEVYTKSTGSFQLPATGNGSPIFDIFSPSYLVRSVAKTSPGFAPTVMEYEYAGLKVQGGGRGSLGYESVTSTDTLHHVTTTTFYNQVFPYIGIPETTITFYDDGTTSGSISDSISTYLKHETVLASGKKTYFPYLSNSVEKEYAFNASINGAGVHDYSITTTAQKTIISDFTYDNDDVLHGNLTTSEIRTCQGSASNSSCTLVESKATSNSYEDSETNWLLGRLSATTVTTTRKVGNINVSKVRSSSFSYDQTTGQLTEETINGNTSEFLRTVHQYDSYGQERATYQCSNHLTTTAQCATPPATARNLEGTYIHRYKKAVYDSEWDEYIEENREPFASYTGFLLWDSTALPSSLDLGSIVEKSTGTIANDPVYNKKRDIYGNPYYVSDIFGTFSRTIYGIFGEPHASASEIGGKTTTIKNWCSQVTHCPATANTVVMTSTLGSASSRAYADVLGREVRRQNQMFDGSWSTVDTYYDQLGRTIRQSDPYSGTAPVFTKTTYDSLDRVLEIESPDHCLEDNTNNSPDENCTLVDVITTTSYSGLSVATTNPNGQVKTQAFD
ncbi:MAG: hypothetical protein JKY19_05095, partial [Alcanivoracaceae bacterium]|nr:hypothetical protein [Alcanivoracaceae bacterium]